jgi:hypothetical protein
MSVPSPARASGEQIRVNWLKRWWNKFFPLYTHCTACGRKLPYKDRAGLCQDCLMW